MSRSDLRAGFLAACLVATGLGGCGPTAPPASQPVQEPVQIFVSGNWPEAEVAEQLANAQRRFADCGIGLTFARSSGPAPQRQVRFVQSLEPVDGKAVEGRALAFSTPQVVEIAWATPDGSPLQHKQILAHELGHLFGLGHAPLHSINLMAPHGCEICRFTPAQCRAMAARANTARPAP